MNIQIKIITHRLNLPNIYTLSMAKVIANASFVYRIMNPIQCSVAVYYAASPTVSVSPFLIFSQTHLTPSSRRGP